MFVGNLVGAREWFVKVPKDLGGNEVPRLLVQKCGENEASWNKEGGSYLGSVNGCNSA